MYTESLKPTEATIVPVFSDEMKEKVVDEIYMELTRDTGKAKLYEILRDGFEGVNSMNDQALYVYGMMHGLFDEDAGEDR